MYLPSQQDMPLDVYESNDDALAEQARELYWRQFQEQVAHVAQALGWPDLLVLVADVMRTGVSPDLFVEQVVEEFAHTEGWPNTLRALARAMAQQDALNAANADPRR